MRWKLNTQNNALELEKYEGKKSAFHINDYL